MDKKLVAEVPSARAVVVNSGVANACTGEEGLACCRRTAEKAAKLLGISENEVLVASTGVIGRQLPMETIEKGVELMFPCWRTRRRREPWRRRPS